jgi:membrane protein YqaA with SNARE-associated domain
MVLARRSRAFVYAFWASVSSVAGGILGYAIGYFLFEAIGQPLLDLYGYDDQFMSFTDQYNKYGAWIVLMAGLTPFPYKVITITSGVTALSFPVFMAASIVARALRFFIVSGLLFWFGQPIRDFIEKYFGLVTIVFFVLLIGGFALVKYLF